MIKARATNVPSKTLTSLMFPILTVKSPSCFFGKYTTWSPNKKCLHSPHSHPAQNFTFVVFLPHHENINFQSYFSNLFSFTIFAFFTTTKGVALDHLTFKCKKFNFLDPGRKSPSSSDQLLSPLSANDLSQLLIQLPLQQIMVYNS